jgi:hypothetical protein
MDAGSCGAVELGDIAPSDYASPFIEEQTSCKACDREENTRDVCAIQARHATCDRC